VYVYEDATKFLVFKVFSEESLEEYEARKDFQIEKAKFEEYERFGRTLVLNSKNVEIVKIHKEDNYHHEVIEKVIEMQKIKSQILNDNSTYRGVGKQQQVILQNLQQQEERMSMRERWLAENFQYGCLQTEEQLEDKAQTAQKIRKA